LSGASLVFVVVLLKSSSFRRPSGVKCFSPLFWDDDDFATNSSPSSMDDDYCAIVDDWITITIVSFLLLLMMMMLMSLRTCWRNKESNTIIRNLWSKQLWITNGFSSLWCGERRNIRKRKKEHKHVAHTVSITKRRSALAFYLSRLDIDNTPPRKIFDWLLSLFLRQTR